MRAAARVVVLVQRGAVEARERPLVGREVRGHPVEDHADAVRVQVVDEVAEVVGRAHRRDGGVEAGHLVAPRARERVLHHRQQLDVREAEVADVRRELVGELAPAEALAPRRRVHLVDRDRPLERLLRRAAPRSSRRRATRTADSKTTDAVFGGSSCLERDRVGLLVTVEVELVAAARPSRPRRRPPRCRSRRPAASGSAAGPSR